MDSIFFNKKNILSKAYEIRLVGDYISIIKKYPIVKIEFISYYLKPRFKLDLFFKKSFDCTICAIIICNTCKE